MSEPLALMSPPPGPVKVLEDRGFLERWPCSGHTALPEDREAGGGGAKCGVGWSRAGLHPRRHASLGSLTSLWAPQSRP